MQVAEWVIDLGKQLAALRSEVFDLRRALNDVTGGSGPVSGRAKAPPTVEKVKCAACNGMGTLAGGPGWDYPCAVCKGAGVVPENKDPTDSIDGLDNPAEIE